MGLSQALEELVYFPLLLLVRTGLLGDPVFDHRADVYVLSQHKVRAEGFLKMRDDLLRFYLTGKCGYSRKQYIENHLEVCEKCRRRVGEIKKDLLSAP